MNQKESSNSWIKNIFNLNLKNEYLKLQFSIPKLFTWNINANAEKGIAGGTIKVNFNMKSAFLLSLLLFIVTLLCRPVTQYLVPSIFLFFTLYYGKMLLKAFIIKLIPKKRIKEGV